MHLTRPLLNSLAAAVLLAATACHGGPSGGLVPSPPSAPDTLVAPGALVAPDAKSPLKLSAKTVAFAGTGVALAKTVTATELKYTGPITQKNTCAKIATVSPKKGKGPKAKFKVTPLAAGSCTLTVSDSHKHKAVAKITVTLTNPALNPTALNFDQTGVSAALTFTASQTSFTGAFNESDTCSGIATVVASSWKGPSAQATVTPTNAGTCTITIGNTSGGSSKIAVTVTTSGIIIQ